MTPASSLAAVDPAVPAEAPRGRRGRPKLLTREQILAATLEMLAEGGLAGFTMGKLAQRLGASVMTLYTYFPSREALLDDTAGSIFNRFEAPDETLPWEQAIEAWLRALGRLFDAHPIGLGLIKWDGAVTPSWLHVWLPLLRILSRAGLSGRDLMIASNWVGRVGLALLMARMTAADEIAAVRRGSLRDGALSPEDHVLLDGLIDEPGDLRSDALYAFGIRNIVRGLGEMVEVS